MVSLLLLVASAAVSSTSGFALPGAFPRAPQATSTAPATLPTLPGAVSSLISHPLCVCSPSAHTLIWFSCVSEWTVRRPLRSMHLSQSGWTGLLRGRRVRGEHSVRVSVLGAGPRLAPNRARCREFRHPVSPMRLFALRAHADLARVFHGQCAPVWAQCTSTNQNWFGPACCEGTVCVENNPFWSQCLALAM